MRRPVTVYGAELKSGQVVTTDDLDIVEIKVHPDGSVDLKDPCGNVETLDDEWVRYTPRYN